MRLPKLFLEWAVFWQVQNFTTDASVQSIAYSNSLTTLAVLTIRNLQERYQDPRGWQILAPSGWNKFDGEVGAYDVKWQDLVDPTDNIKVATSPVKSTTTSM